jgi:hypothetical protein
MSLTLISRVLQAGGWMASSFEKRQDILDHEEAGQVNDCADCH